ncbi:unnamed protein product [Protopolystoma xenopodis]|uniref:Uncharacterized protein n=1 Tax=Protopolystoma xenopodis TaxID=117903 RepID=A0A3S4ZWE6_9PLAT|nr:unnamed protein product [Protopolystoma xenopodis]
MTVGVASASRFFVCQQVILAQLFCSRYGEVQLEAVAGRTSSLQSDVSSAPGREETRTPDVSVVLQLPKQRTGMVPDILEVYTTGFYESLAQIVSCPKEQEGVMVSSLHVSGQAEGSTIALVDLIGATSGMRGKSGRTEPK